MFEQQTIRRNTIVICAGILAILQGGCKERPPEAALQKEIESGVRRMHRAGVWYPGEPKKLRSQLGRYLQQARLGKQLLNKRPVGLIIPHATYSASGATAAHAFKVLARHPNVRRVIIVGVVHIDPPEGISLPRFRWYRTPLGSVEVDSAAVASLRGEAPFNSVPWVHWVEHSVEAQLPLLKYVQPGAKILPMMVGTVDEAGLRRAGKLLAPLMRPDTVFIVSSDFTHRGRWKHWFEVDRRDGESLAAALKRLDHGAIPAIRDLDFSGLLAYRRQTGITICGWRALGLMMVALRQTGQPVTTHALHYSTSATARGTWDWSVSYLSVALMAPGEEG